eukprot:4040073-Prymnesium_polylepis.1
MSWSTTSTKWASPCCAAAVRARSMQYGLTSKPIARAPSRAMRRSRRPSPQPRSATTSRALTPARASAASSTASGVRTSGQTDLVSLCTPSTGASSSASSARLKSHSDEPSSRVARWARPASRMSSSASRFLMSSAAPAGGSSESCSSTPSISASASYCFRANLNSLSSKLAAAATSRCLKYLAPESRSRASSSAEDIERCTEGELMSARRDAGPTRGTRV